MRWFGWLRCDEKTSTAEEPLDLDRLLFNAFQDPASARLAISQLKDARKRMRRQERSIEKQFNRLTPRRIRNIGRSGPAMGSYQLSQAMQDMNSLSHESDRAEQEALVARQLAAVDDALERLKAYADRR